LSKQIPASCHVAPSSEASPARSQAEVPSILEYALAQEEDEEESDDDEDEDEAEDGEDGAPRERRRLDEVRILLAWHLVTPSVANYCLRDLPECRRGRR
jgi:hypothetical protein